MDHASPSTSSLVALEWSTPYVAIVKLNDPRHLNAMTVGMAEQFASIVGSLGQLGETELRAVVITGVGRAFSAGGDLGWLEERTSDTRANNKRIMHDFYSAILTLRSLPIPVIAAINGAAYGAGLCLALACDMRIAARGAKLCLPFTNLGLHPGMGGSVFVAMSCGWQKAFELLLLGKQVQGDAAEALGLVTLARDGAALKDALALAHEIAARPPHAVRATLQTLRTAQDKYWALEEALRKQADAQADGFANGECKNAIAKLRSKL